MPTTATTRVNHQPHGSGSCNASFAAEVMRTHLASTSDVRGRERRAPNVVNLYNLMATAGFTAPLDLVGSPVPATAASHDQPRSVRQLGRRREPRLFSWPQRFIHRPFRRNLLSHSFRRYIPRRRNRRPALAAKFAGQRGERSRAVDLSLSRHRTALCNAKESASINRERPAWPSEGVNPPSAVDPRAIRSAAARPTPGRSFPRGRSWHT